MKVIWTKRVPQTGLGWGYLVGEMKELLDEIVKLSWTGMYNELCDVYTVLMCIISNKTGIDVPIFWTKSAEEWVARIEVWEAIFEKNGLLFKPEYLINGGNYKKQWKVDAALELARKDQKEVL